MYIQSPLLILEFYIDSMGFLYKNLNIYEDMGYMRTKDFYMKLNLNTKSKIKSLTLLDEINPLLSTTDGHYGDLLKHHINHNSKLHNAIFHG